MTVGSTTQQHFRLRRLIAGVGSGVLLAFSYSLEPVWFLAWLAPVPLLVAVVSTTSRRAFAIGMLTGLIGSTTFLGYMAMLGGPLDAALIAVLRGAQWGLFALAARTAFR